MIKLIYFVHGTTIDNENHVSSGWYNVPLSTLGIQQSVELKDLLQNTHFDAVFCSDLSRAIDSAELAFGNREIEIVTDTRLRECNYGIYNAKLSEIVEPIQETKILDKFPEGESYEDVKDRISEFLKFLRQNYDNKVIAIVGHKAPQLALDVLINGKSWGQAFAEDWRKTGSWQPGWEYIVK